MAVVGMVWGSFNVQHNLMAGTPLTDPRYWLAYLYEPIITLPLVAMMYLATTASREGQVIAKARIAPIEIGLLLLSLVINITPYVIAGDLQKSFEYSIAPVMIAAVIPMHSLAAKEFAKMIGGGLPRTESLGAAEVIEPTPTLVDVA
ncbi:hypothetical protein [Nocardia alni]|uniref:hypothetical protein n=1 Tax=Nocardia alni TaxID=2815723 RepID=UPI001C236226|nr:hypothetical protein [Nocardia alni]